MENHPNRRLNWEACYNVRDLGGYPLEGGKTTRWGAFVRADNLYRLTQTGQASLSRYGIRTIIDLRGPDELLMTPNPFADHATVPGSIEYHNVPLIAEENGPALAALKQARSNREGYRTILEFFTDRFGAILRIMASAPAGGILFHCYAGKDRTGLTAMLLLALAGAADEVIAADYSLSDRYLTPLYDEILLNAPEDPAEQENLRQSLYAREEYIYESLAFLRRHFGGIEAYLLHCGLSQADLAALRARLAADGQAGD